MGSILGRLRNPLLLLIATLTLTSCGGSIASSAVDAANLALTKANCNEALSHIEPVYNSSNSNNDVRLIMASTYGCLAGVNFLGLLDHLVSFSGNLGGTGFWQFLVQEFPSSSTPVDDKKPQAAIKGIEAAFSVVKPGAFLTAPLVVNSGTQNPGSLVFTDRADEANTYITFLSMSLMGSLLSRYGAPDSNHNKTQNLPWTTAATMTEDGCAVASGVLNYYDGIHFIQTASTGTVAMAYGVIQAFLGAGLDAACSAGCTLCGGGMSCSGCPSTLRDRKSCTGSSTDVNSCAAAGLIQFVNLSWI